MAGPSSPVVDRQARQVILRLSKAVNQRSLMSAASAGWLLRRVNHPHALGVKDELKFVLLGDGVERSSIHEIPW